ncbi:MAG: helix-turn-helix transcriptional regulator [Methyloprofundus sp.]|nr:helix-turn-helix transcriptional regulator [Methyloprofundus sp.]
MAKEMIPIGNILSAKDAGNIVSQYRKKQNLTQVELAGLAQTGTRFISELENGKATAQFDKVMHVLHLLGVDVLATERSV